MPILIFLIGFLSIYSASFKSGQSIDQTLAMRQFLWMAIGVLFVLLIVRVDYFKLQDMVWPLYYVSIFLLVIVLFMPARLGAHRWIPLGGFNFQPSELAKFSMILALSQFFSDHRPAFLPKSKWIGLFMMVAVPFVLILKEPDLGTALILIPIFFAMLYLWGFKVKTIFIFIGIACLVSPVLFHFLKGYQKDRLLVFINPNADPLGAGYTIIQSKIAIGSGGLFGKGFMGGTQNQLKFIPERHTDFIFAVIAEEGGLIASVIVLIFFWVIVKKGFTICSQIPDRFGSELACGISTMLGLQTIINLGMTMGLFPVVGVPLPLISYGGSSIVITMLSIGILLNLKMHRPLF
ncbi:MAG: rod shape-determining protein RodA [Candidatus Omnitrophica bacterium CG1_02_46_14]|nr:MAG: rod shape-determining protein RodA [Candidatus Omnitrophica bacterium CG1_02_46_14]